jgi:hypothetical protein
MPGSSRAWGEAVPGERAARNTGADTQYRRASRAGWLRHNACRVGQWQSGELHWQCLLGSPHWIADTIEAGMRVTNPAALHHAVRCGCTPTQPSDTVLPPLAPLAPPPPLQVVVDSLYREEGGHECLRDTVQAVVAGVRNPAHLELSINAVQLLTRCGERLAAWEAAGHRDEGPSSRGIATASGVDTGGWRPLVAWPCMLVYSAWPPVALLLYGSCPAS